MIRTPDFWVGWSAGVTGAALFAGAWLLAGIAVLVGVIAVGVLSDRCDDWPAP